MFKFRRLLTAILSLVLVLAIVGGAIALVRKNTDESGTAVGELALKSDGKAVETVTISRDLRYSFNVSSLGQAVEKFSVTVGVNPDADDFSFTVDNAPYSFKNERAFTNAFTIVAGKGVFSLSVDKNLCLILASNYSGCIVQTPDIADAPLFLLSVTSGKQSVKLPLTVEGIGEACRYVPDSIVDVDGIRLDRSTLEF